MPNQWALLDRSLQIYYMQLQLSFINYLKLIIRGIADGWQIQGALWPHAKYDAQSHWFQHCDVYASGDRVLPPLHAWVCQDCATRSSDWSWRGVVPNAAPRFSRHGSPPLLVHPSAAGWFGRHFCFEAGVSSVSLQAFLLPVSDIWLILFSRSYLSKIEKKKRQAKEEREAQYAEELRQADGKQVALKIQNDLETLKAITPDSDRQALETAKDLKYLQERQQLLGSIFLNCNHWHIGPVILILHCDIIWLIAHT